ncbi:ankyrin repeat-containing domain protein [Apodospora peruviana]|uniref:Ankyrin repeat-containing domain protein n=1 Tax=Apodospora peruviana TaxID=516989 RepID=A0AAE0HV54_9PEZI|nr:ankyrin repeat-containing domain protein [Apodospora peruviana]
MADPLSITTAIITLTRTVQSVTKLIVDFANADEIVAEIKNDCQLAAIILASIKEQLEADLRPTSLENGANGRSRVDLASVLRDNVLLLQQDVELLLAELPKHLAPHETDTRFNGIIANGMSSATLAWRKAYFDGMHRRIQSKLTPLQLVQSNLQAQAHARALERRNSRDSIDAQNMYRHQFRRRVSAGPFAQEQLIKAVREKNGTKAEEMLQQVDPNFPSDDKNGLFPLHIAAKNGDGRMVMLLLDYDAKVNCSHDKESPLMLSLANNHDGIALTLIGHGANLSQADSHGQTALHIAARKSLFSVVQVLLNNGADPNARDHKGRTPLLECVCGEDREIVPHDATVLRLLLEREVRGVKADPSMGTEVERINPISLAAQHGFMEDLEILAEAARSRRIDLNSQAVLDHMNHSPLWYAASTGQVDAIKLLIRYGADVNHCSGKDQERPTALWAMASLGCLGDDDPEGLLALLRAGAKPDLGRNEKKQTLLVKACESGDARLVDLLLRHHADPREPDQLGMQAIHHAAKNGHQKCVEQLLRCETYRVDLNCTDNNGATPLIHAAMKGHDFLIKFLVYYDNRNGAGADWNRADKFGSNAFYVACGMGHLCCAIYLHGLGADINLPNKNMKTPLHIAARMGHDHTVLWLLRMGAKKDARCPETPAEMAKSANFEAIASLIDGWTLENSMRVTWTVTGRLD